MLIALLLLVVGQLVAAASAQGATCPRAALRRSAVAAASRIPAFAAAAVFVSERDHHTSLPVGDLPAVPSSICTAVIALPEQGIEYLLPVPSIVDVSSRVASPPGDPFASSFFRPPRLS
jgi:hypothetical protein